MSVSNKLDILLNFIREKTGAQTIEALDYRQLSGGAIQENYGLRVLMAGGEMPGEQSFVVRSDAPASLAASLSRSQEFNVLEVAYRAGVKAPRPYWLCTDRSLLGTEFYIMQWARGSAAPGSLVKDDGLTAAQRRSLTFELGSNLARLHQIRYAPEVLPFLSQPVSDAAAQRIKYYKNALQRLGTAHPAIDLGLAKLGNHIPQDQEWVLCHCDFRTGNYLVDDGNFVALLDWEFATWSDPYEDLGWMCAKSWRFARTDREAGGVGDKADLFAGYESISGRPVDPERVAYWEVMASVRWAIIALEQSQRHISGQQESLELALTGWMLPEIEQDLMSHLQSWLSRIGHGVPVQNLASVLPPASPAQSADFLYSELPRGADLLQVARSLMLSEVLLATPPEQNYSARMVAKAMGIAMRELQMGDVTRREQSRLIEQFYKEAGLALCAHALQGLAQDIRQERFSEQQQPALFGLVEGLLNQRLMLSNPKRLEHRKL